MLNVRTKKNSVYPLQPADFGTPLCQPGQWAHRTYPKHPPLGPRPWEQKLVASKNPLCLLWS